MAFKEISIESLNFNPFEKISKEWMLITAGDEEKSNTMTASWGGVGIMWRKNVVTAYIRPQRYTKEFVDSNEMFTISFLPEEYRKSGQKAHRSGDPLFPRPGSVLWDCAVHRPPYLSSIP